MVCFRDSPVAIAHKNKAADGLGGSKNALIQNKSRNKARTIGKKLGSLGLPKKVMKKVLKRGNRRSSTKFSRSLCNNSYERQGLNNERVSLRVLVALFSQL